MTIPNKPTLKTRVDGFSYQAFTAEDRRFWFRLERHGERDVVTDYHLGSFPREYAEELLAECYRVLGLTPGMVIVSRDLAPEGGAVDPAGLEATRDLYASSGRGLLIAQGARAVVKSLELEHGKYNLVLMGEL